MGLNLQPLPGGANEVTTHHIALAVLRAPQTPAQALWGVHNTIVAGFSGGQESHVRQVGRHSPGLATLLPTTKSPNSEHHNGKSSYS
jgi:hypothetical protein